MMAVLLLASTLDSVASDFRILPYLQNPAADAMTLLWFSESATPGQLSVSGDGHRERHYTSTPRRTASLAYSRWEANTFFANQAPPPPYRHRVRLTGLVPNRTYTYTVRQGPSHFSGSFTTPPDGRSAIRFIAYADCETEPESSGRHARWTAPNPDAHIERRYLLDQTQGYANNLAVMASRHPNFITISGDLVEAGGEQRDWDEFWRHVASPDGPYLASQVPFFAVPGNHEYYEGRRMDRYNPAGSKRAIDRFRTYFEFPPNGVPHAEDTGTYYRIDYGPITLVALDVANGSPSRSQYDTNFFLSGENDPEGGHAPDFTPGSRQYAWLEQQLAAAQAKSAFTFVILHHVPYSVGPHGWPPGDQGSKNDTQSGVPVRVLTPLLMRFGVDAVLAGHDEIWERSEVAGHEQLPNGHRRAHVIHFYDLGTGGDSLRGPQPELDNPYQKFLAHRDAPERWKGGVLIEGGKHYGHLEIDIVLIAAGGWKAVLKPVYVLPLFDRDGTYRGYERRLYDDIVTLVR